MEDKMLKPNTIYLEPNKPPYQNKIYKLPVEIMDGYADLLKTGKLYEKYNDAIKELTLPEASIADLQRIEAEYIKKDLEYISQAYFANYIDYPIFISSVHNIMTAFNIIRQNWQVQHNPNVVKDTEVIDNQ